MIGTYSNKFVNIAFLSDAVDDLESTNESIDTSNLETMHAF